MLKLAVRDARVAKGLSQSGLGTLAGLSRQSVQSIEAGRSVPSVEVALRLAAALERPIEDLFSLASPTSDDASIVIAGSDDLALERAVDMLRERGGPLLSLSRLGTTAGLEALLAGAADLAAIHGIAPASVVGDVPLASIVFARREQGLVFRPGEPYVDIADVVARKARFAARRNGSGTRALLDAELARAGIAARALVGYATQHPRHADVMGAILGGQADCGIALRADARHFGLGFTPIAWEDFCLAGRPEVVRSDRTAALRALLRDRAFRATVESLGGYDMQHSGRVSTL